MSILTLPQKLFPDPQLPSSITVEVCDEQEDCDWEAAFEHLLDSIEEPAAGEDGDEPVQPIGIAPLFSPPDSYTEYPGSTTKISYIEYLAFSTKKRVVVIKAPAQGWDRVGYNNWEAFSNFLAGKAHASSSYVLVGFELSATILACLREGKLRVRGVDLSVLHPDKPWLLPSTVMAEMLGATPGREFEKMWRRLPLLERGEEKDEARLRLEVERVAWRAWMSAVVAIAKSEIITDAVQVDTQPRDDLDTKNLDILAHLQAQYDQLEASKPDKIISEHTGVSKHGIEVTIKQAAYKNRARKGQAQEIRLLRAGEVLAEGRVTDTQGKETIIAIDGANPDLGETDVDAIEIIGRDDLTNAEIARNSFITQLLQGKQSLQQSDFIRKIWFPSDEDKEDLNAVKATFGEKDAVDESEEVPEDTTAQVEPPPGLEKPSVETPAEDEEDPFKETMLNPSQANVARAMVSKNSFALVHGPPGTGKTRTIAEVVKVWVESGKTAYLVAQTNVGVKNIAEALIKQDITAFKLLVSNEFYQEWHEKEFEKCVKYMVTSKEFKTQLRKLKGVKVILCTMNMLFSQTLDKIGLWTKLPLERLVVDEASQIFVGDYLALFYKFRDSLKKVCWFGDPSQLPPHQREQISGLQSIYDIDHVKQASLLLDTQYRMPPEVGNFVSGAMYEGKLKSNPEHIVPGFSCLKFVDVAIGEEKMQNTSWINEREAQTIVHLVRHYYHNLSFSVITPYDSQRKLIEKKLVEQGLPGKGRCYNVDSFQGNEDEYILISCVRTAGTGFLDLHNRINVMLTRCQRGMVIVTQREFLRKLGRQTLIGRLADDWNSTEEHDVEQNAVWAYYRDVMNKTVDMPGAKGDPKPVEPVRPKPVEQPAISGFFAPAVPAWNIGAGWGSTPTAPPRNPSPPKTNSSPPKRSPINNRTPTHAPSPWGHVAPAITANVTPLAGAWGAGRPAIAKPKAKAKPQQAPAPTTSWTISSLPSQTGGSRGSRR